uniref:UDP-N-acetylglucosamine--peptide N-acetylglucosaminyltransferase SPINDLY n=1 Tax=Kalanchoe fedtschenkoi TaxID=63787 RepID=A0A7N0USP9_KALFE
MSEFSAATGSSAIETSKSLTSSSKPAVIADLNDNPPETDDDLILTPDLSSLVIASGLVNDENSQDRSSAAYNDGDSVDGESKRLSRLGKSRSRNKVELPLDAVAEADGEQPGQGPPSREEKVSSLKTGLVHVARKMPKNAHAHFILGLMYQRLGQPLKAVTAYEKAAEILLKCDEEIDRPEFLSLVQLHQAQCILLGNMGDYGSDKELEPEVIEETIAKMKESVKRDSRQAAVWNTLGYILLKSSRVQSAISILSTLMALVPGNLDCICNLGLAYLQRGNIELSEKCFQQLLLKDQNHPAALINYAALMLCKHGSIVAGPGASGDEGSPADQLASINVAKECLLVAVKANPKSAHIWANLGYTYYIIGDYKSSSRCLEKAAKLDPSCMPIRYAVAMLRIKETERSQDPSEHISWAGNEMASILREGDPGMIEPAIAWSGLALVHKTQHEIATTYESGPITDSVSEISERAAFCLKQAVAENPDDAVQWHQLGLHSLCTQQFQASAKYLKAAVSRLRDCSYMWSNLGVSLLLSKEPSQAEEVFKRALSLSTPQQAHTIFSNLGILYRHQKQYDRAKAMFTKALELRPGYAPAYNNLGLVFVAEGRLEGAKYCFEKAFQTDPLLDAAKSNFIKVASILKASTEPSSLRPQDSSRPVQD